MIHLRLSNFEIHSENACSTIFFLFYYSSFDQNFEIEPAILNIVITFDFQFFNIQFSLIEFAVAFPFSFRLIPHAYFNLEQYSFHSLLTFKQKAVEQLAIFPLKLFSLPKLLWFLCDYFYIVRKIIVQSCSRTFGSRILPYIFGYNNLFLKI